MALFYFERSRGSSRMISILDFDTQKDLRHFVKHILQVTWLDYWPLWTQARDRTSAQSATRRSSTSTTWPSTAASTRARSRSSAPSASSGSPTRASGSYSQHMNHRFSYCKPYREKEGGRANKKKDGDGKSGGGGGNGNNKDRDVSSPSSGISNSSASPASSPLAAAQAAFFHQRLDGALSPSKPMPRLIELPRDGAHFSSGELPRPISDLICSTESSSTVFSP